MKPSFTYDISKFKCYRYPQDGSIYYGDIAFIQTKTNHIVINITFLYFIIILIIRSSLWMVWRKKLRNYISRFGMDMVCRCTVDKGIVMEWWQSTRVIGTEIKDKVKGYQCLKMDLYLQEVSRRINLRVKGSLNGQ